MADIKFEIKQTLTVLSTAKTGWTKELNMVSWNDAPAKYDLRDWSPDHARMSKGVTLSKDEFEELAKFITDKK